VIEDAKRIPAVKGTPQGAVIRGLHSARNEATAHDRGVKRVCIPIAARNAPSGSANKRSAGSSKDRNGGPVAKGRISLLKRRHGLRRCIYWGDSGMKHESAWG
jgi:IS5 family transposase